MQRVSDLYRREQRMPIAGPMLVKITLGLVDADAAATATVTADAGLVFSTPQTMVREEGTPARVYATLEPGRLLADGKQRILPRDPALLRGEGFVSAVMSGADGSFAQPPVVEITFTKTHTVAALTLTFDRATGDYPAVLRIRAWRGREQLCDRTVQPDAADYTAMGEIERFDKLEFAFITSHKPYRRARLQQVMFGVGLLMDNRLVQSMTQKREVDPITRRLPQSSIKFAVVNTNRLTGEIAGLYDPDNPQGVWRYMELHSPVKVEYGQYITHGTHWKDLHSQRWGELELTTWRGLHDGGYVEWLPGGRYYLDAAPKVDGLTANFSAFDAMGLLKGQYYKGVCDGQKRSMYELAEAVLVDAQLPLLYDQGDPWRLWEGMREVYTTAPLPLKSHRELLQLLAHACCCVLHCNREGVICIQPAPVQPEELLLDFEQMTSQPVAEKIPTLYRVDCPVHSYAAQGEVRELHRGSYMVQGERTLHLSFAAAVIDTVVVQGGQIAEQRLYTCAADLTLTGSGTVTVAITGRTLKSSQLLVSAVAPKADVNAAVELLSNPMITSERNAAAVAVWVAGYLAFRTGYQFESRGNPECDPLDNIEMQSAFDNSFPAVVLSNEVTFDGGLRGKMKCKRMVKGEI